MFGLIGKIGAAPGMGAELLAVLLEGADEMPGCLSYIVATDAADPDIVWVTEVWDAEESQRNSLQLPAVRAAIARGMPLIAGFETTAQTIPVGGLWLPGT